MDVYDCILTRRSSRKFSDKEIDDSKLQKIINAGRYAPSGTNTQLNHFIVIKKKDVLKDLGELVRSIFLKMSVGADTPKHIARCVKAAEKENSSFYYNSPLLIIVANRIANPNNIADAACAIENMMLMANALDLGSCWINQLRWLNENPELRNFLQTFGMLEDEVPYGSVAIGYAATEDGLPIRKALERTGNSVTMIE